MERKGKEPERDTEELDKDVKLLLDSVEPVFQSRNPAVSKASAFSCGKTLITGFFVLAGRGCSHQGLLLRSASLILAQVCAAAASIVDSLSRG